jgi:hypothetical protein
MRGESQASHLENLMRGHPFVTDYALTLPAVELKRSARKRLQKGDILLLHLDSPELHLQHEGKLMAEVSMECGYDRVTVSHIHETEKPLKEHNSKKYEILLCTFGTLRCKELKKGASLDISALEMTSVTLFADGKQFAYGSPVWVEKKIAVEITKVIK